MSERFTKGQAAAAAPALIDEDVAQMSASDLLETIARAVTQRQSPEAEAIDRVGYAMSAAAPLPTGLPPEGEEELHPNHWLLVHRGLDQKAVADYDFPVSNIYSGLVVRDAAGKYYTYTIAAGLQWIPTWAFSGAFDRPQDQLLAKAVEAGIIDIIPPGMALDVRTLGHELKDKLAQGAMQLCRDARTMRFFAELAGGVNKAVMLRKADELDPGKRAPKPKTVGDFANASK